MKYVLFFITHATLTSEHAELTFTSISHQDKLCIFDKIYIYNTHKHELSNDTIDELYTKYNLNSFFKEKIVFNYDEASNKSLGHDVETIANYCKATYCPDDRILFLKSDCLLSKNYFKELFNLQPRPVFFTAPFVCAKKRISNDEIIEYTLRETCVRSDEITFFVEDYNQSDNNDFHTRPGTNVTDNAIRFTCCYVIRDWSCHCISVSLLHLLSISKQSWGGVNLSNLIPYFAESENCFVVHKYHNIVSNNRNNSREGSVESWLLS